MSKHLDIVWTNQFKKDYKLAMKRHLDIDLLDDIIRKLASSEQLPEKNKDHALTGNWVFDSRVSVEHSFRNVARWKSLSGEYDILCAGNGIHDAVSVDRYYDTLKYILEGHAGKGEEYYVPHEDARSKVSELDGKKVHLRRSPDMDMVADAMKAAGMEKFLELTDGR